MALLAGPCPTIPCETGLGSRVSESPSPLMCECAPILSMRVTALTSCTCPTPTPTPTPCNGARLLVILYSYNMIVMVVTAIIML